MDVHVLIADDNEDHRFLTRRALSSLVRADASGEDSSASGGDASALRFVVMEARDGEETLAILRKEGAHASRPRPDFILLDLKMPKRDGFAVLAAAKGDPSLRGLPIIVLSSSDNDGDVRRAYDLGANAYLVKPMNGAAFAERIRESVRFWVRVALLPPREES